MTSLPFTSSPDPWGQRPMSVPAPGGSASTSDPDSAGAAASSGGLDPALIQQTKRELRQIVQEITQLSQSDISEGQFYEEFLQRVVSALAADGGAVWVEGDEGELNLQYQIQFPASLLSGDRAGQARHAMLVRNVFQSGQSTLVPPQSGSTTAEEAGNPTDCLLILATLKLEQQVVGVVEIFQRAGGGPTTQRGFLRFLVQMVELASDFLKSRRLRHLGDRQSLWDSLERFLRRVHRGLDLQTTLFTIVNESRPLIECNRVSLALRSGSQYTIRAVSGLDSIDRRAAEIRLLGKLATVVTAAGKPLWYTGDSRDIPPQIEGPLQAYLDQSHARLVGILPLHAESVEGASGPASEATRTANDRGSGSPPSRAIGVLIVEKLGDDRCGDGFVDRVNAVAAHSATALSNAIEHHSLFLLPLWKTLGQARCLVEARNLLKAGLAAAAILIAVLGLVLVPADFELAARGKLQPVIRRDVFAQINGVVVDVPVRHEDSVTSEQVLARLTNNELEIQISNLIGRKQTTHERINNVQRSLLSERRLSIEERNRLDGELLELRQVEESIDQELLLQQQKQQQLIVRSEMAGQVVTWNVRELLLRRPVEIGQVLMTIVDPTGPWELELYMPERRMGHITAAAEESRDGLHVSFLLASHPGQEFAGRVVEIQRTAEVRGDEGNVVVLRVALDKDTLPELRSDSTVTARVHCGRRGFGYVWFHEVFETIHTKLLLWF